MLYPLTFKPLFKERIWGGRRLEQLYGKSLPPNVPIGESWEISDRPGDVSVIINGPWAGRDLRWLMETHGQAVLGATSSPGQRFPLLIKILDCREKLSLQVHPPASRARALAGEPKTEMWYVAHAEPGAELYVGLKRGTSRPEFEARLRDGTVDACFHRVQVRAGDAMFLPSGRVHALGAGLVIFEIQQNSDTTFRVFDWNRVGLDGKPRELHVAQSLQCIDFGDFEPGLVKPEDEGRKGRRLVSSELFSVYLVEASGSETVELEPGCMQILAVVAGQVRVHGGGQSLVLAPGQFCLLPAGAGDLSAQADPGARCLRVAAGSAIAP